MATTSPLQAVPLPDASDADDVPYNLGAAVDAMEKRLVMVYASATDRDSKIATPEEGMIAYLQDVNEWTAHDGSGWHKALVQNSSGAVVIDGSLTVGGDVIGNSLQVQPSATGGDAVVYIKNSAGTTRGELAAAETVNHFATASVGDLILRADSGKLILLSTANEPVAVQGSSGQTANLQEWQNNAGTPLAWIDSAGNPNFPFAPRSANYGVTAGSGQALPGAPWGWVKFNIGGVTAYMPYWD